MNSHLSFRRVGLAVAVSLATITHAYAALPVRAEFTGAQAEHTWTLAELDPELPADWTPFDYLVLEFKASSSQRFFLGLETANGRIAKRIGPFAGVWVRASIPLRFYREPAGSAIDLAATFNQPRGSYWINIGGRSGHGPTIGMHGLTVAMDYPVGAPTLEIRAIALAREDSGDAVLEGLPLVDEFGQYAHADWPEKARTVAELKQAWTREAAEIESPLPARCPYGGIEHTSAEATGFFRLEEIDGRWWFVCPDGHLFFSSGVNGVGPAIGTRVAGREDLFAALPPQDLLPSSPGGRRLGGSFYTWNLQRRFGDDWRPQWVDFTTQRFAAWGLNTIHYWGPRDRDAGAEPRVPYAQMLRGWQTTESIMGMPDVYADDFPQRVEEAAASQLGPRKDDPWMLGYFIGNEPPWPNREGQLCDLILAGPDSPIKRRLQEQLAGGDSPDRRREFVHAAFVRYLEVINAACRRHAPRHLNLGIRFGGNPHDDLVQLAGGSDVFSINIYRYAPPRETLDRVHQLTKLPILIGEFHIGVPERGLAPGLVQAMNQEERAYAYRYYVEQCAAHPALVGTHWFQWLDQPVTGRNDGENYNIGFIDVTDQPYRELIAAAQATHARLLEIHRGNLAPVERLPKASAAGTPVPANQASAPAGRLAPRPLYRDPPFDAPTDPVLVFNAERGVWLMYYTARRGNLSPEQAPGVTWIHGTNIGVAASADGGATWSYLGVADIGYGKDAHPGDYTYWAPEVIWHGGTYHMFLTFVPGVFTDWNHPRELVHLTSSDGLTWTTLGRVDLQSDRVIDATVLQLRDGTWRMWYKDERMAKMLCYANSRDLVTWTPQGNAVTDFNGEGPKVVQWHGRYWLAADTWATGIRVWSSDDALHWQPQDETLPGHHGDIVISGGRAWWFYFGGERARSSSAAAGEAVAAAPPARNRRTTAINVVELSVIDGKLIAADPGQPATIDLQPQREAER